jgi:hypothetical protein
MQSALGGLGIQATRGDHTVRLSPNPLDQAPYLSYNRQQKLVLSPCRALLNCGARGGLPPLFAPHPRQARWWVRI